MPANIWGIPREEVLRSLTMAGVLLATGLQLAALTTNHWAEGSIKLNDDTHSFYFGVWRFCVNTTCISTDKLDWALATGIIATIASVGDAVLVGTNAWVLLKTFTKKPYKWWVDPTTSLAIAVYGGCNIAGILIFVKNFFLAYITSSEIMDARLGYSFVLFVFSTILGILSGLCGFFGEERGGRVRRSAGDTQNIA